MPPFKRFGKIILFDGLALLCFILAALVGWLPGPGGLPLVLAGLGLLTINHTWAEHLLDRARQHGKTLRSYIFPETPYIQALYDSAVMVGVTLSLILIIIVGGHIMMSIAAWFLCVWITIFILNRQRWDRLTRWLKQLG